MARTLAGYCVYGARDRAAAAAAAATGETRGRLDVARKSGNVTGRKTTGFGGSRWIMYDI